MRLDTRGRALTEHAPTGTDTTADAPLALRGVTKSRGAFVLRDVDLAVPRGQVVGLVGANGAGKTTAIQVALGALLPDAGSVHLIDKALVGVVLDAPPYPPDWTADKTCRLLAPFYPGWDDARYGELLEWAGIDPAQHVRELSRGMGMRLQLAVALAHGAELLILDEPTSGIDPLGRRQLLDLLAEFMVDERHSVLFSTHIGSDLERLADLLVVLGAGRVLASGTTEDVLDGHRLVRGGPGTLPDAVRPLVRGLREHEVGWSGLMATEDTVHVVSAASIAGATDRVDVVAERPGIDELVSHLVQGTDR